jgi:biotin carboxyl carrier protein
MPSDRETLGRLADGELGELLGILEGSDIEELELNLAGTRLYFRREPGVAGETAPSATSPNGVATGSDTIFVVAERVGFFHHQSDRAAPLKPGDPVLAGQTIGVIDSLNVPISVQAPGAGEIEEVLVEEGQPVEYGQPLFVISPNRDGGA